MFKDVIGQELLKKQLLDMVAQNRLSHALILLGKEGSGTLPLAMAFASYISLLPSRNAVATDSLFGEADALTLPTDPASADEWMQKQPGFPKAADMVHPDIHYSYPTVQKKPNTPPISNDYASEWREFFKQFPYGNVFDWLQFIGAENKQGNITAAECNDIIRKLSLKSFESAHKVLVMWMPEYLGKEGNKLLKLIEEPPENTFFILAAENDAQILGTILSRCQLVKLPALPAKDIENHLLENAGLPTDRARFLANASEGNFREALHQLNHADEDFLGILREWLNAAVKNRVAELLKVNEEINRLGREKQKQLLRQALHLIEQAVRLQAFGPAHQEQLMAAMSAAEAEFAQRLNKAMGLEQKQELAEEFTRAAYYVERNAHAKMLFHALAIRVHHLVKHNVVIR